MPQEFKITKHDDGQRADRFIRKTFPNIPLSMIYKIFRKKDIKRNGKILKKDEIICEGDLIKIFFKSENFKDNNKQTKKTPDFDKIYQSAFFKANFHLLYEDDYFMILNKPTNLAVHPGTSTAFARNLIDLATAYIKNQDKNAPNPALAHRLDKDTSGAIIISKNNSTLRKITEDLRKGQIRKYYLTLVKGHLKEKSGIIDEKILRTSGGVQVSNQKGAKKAMTNYSVQKEFKNSSLLRVEIKTGRMHQIRVHFASINHPVLGDDKHGDFEFNHEFQKKCGLKRQFLHAERLIFTHPETGEKIDIQAPLAKDLKNCLDKL